MIYFSNEIALRSETTTPNQYGDKAKTYSDTIVWAEVASIMRNEFYDASRAGIALEIAFKIHIEDWENQTSVLYEGEAMKSCALIRKMKAS